MTSATDLQLIQDLTSKLQPLTEEPECREDDKSDEPGVNHFGWSRLFSSLCEIEKQFSTKLEELTNHETMEKAQKLFHEYIKSMIRLGFNVNGKFIWGSYPLFQAIKMDCLTILRTLCFEKVDVNQYAEIGTTPLCFAVSCDHKQAATILMDNGADVNKRMIKVYDSTYPIHHARSPEMVRLLHSRCADVNQRSKKRYHWSALHFAASCCRKDAIAALLDLGARDFRIEPTNEKALDIAKNISRDKISAICGGNKRDADECISLLEKV